MSIQRSGSVTASTSPKKEGGKNNKLDMREVEVTENKSRVKFASAVDQSSLSPSVNILNRVPSKWLPNVKDGLNRNKFLKYGLPSSVWVRVCNFLHPEENIRLSTVTHRDWYSIFDGDGRFFTPTDGDSSAPLPQWYNPNNLVIRYETWSRCPADDRSDLFELFTDIHVLRIDNRCISLPAKDLYNLIKRNTATLEKISILKLNIPRSLHYRFDVPSSVEIDRLDMSYEETSWHTQHRRSAKFDNLKSIEIEGSKALAWIPFLRCFRTENVDSLTLRLPPLIQSLIPMGESKDLSNLLLRKASTITRFFIGLSSLKEFRFYFNPLDSAASLLASYCLKWIGTANGSKYLELIEFGGGGIHALLQCLHSHFIEVLCKDGGVPDLLSSTSITIPTKSEGGEILSAPRWSSPQLSERSHESIEFSKMELPSALLQPFSVVNVAEAVPINRAFDDLDFKKILEQKVAAVKTLVEGGFKPQKSHGRNMMKPSATRADDPVFSLLISQEKLRHTTRKSLKVLRGRLNKLLLFRISEPCGVWSEFCWIRKVFGSQCHIEIEEFNGSLVDPLLGEVLPIIAPHVRRMRLTTGPASPLVDYKPAAGRPFSIGLNDPVAHPLRPFEFLRYDQTDKENKALLLKRLATVTITDASLDVLHHLPHVEMPYLEFLSISGVHPTNNNIVIPVLKRWNFPTVKSRTEVYKKQPLLEPPEKQKTPVTDRSVERNLGPNFPFSKESSRSSTGRKLKEKKGVRVRLLDFKPAEKLELELIFSELAVKGNQTIKNNELINSIQQYLEFIEPDVFSVAPIPDPYLLEAFERVCEGTTVEIRPYFATRGANVWSHIKVSGMNVVSMSPKLRRIEEIVLGCYQNVDWLMHCALQRSFSRKRYLQPLSIHLEPSLESLVAVAFAWDNFRLARSVGPLVVDRLFQATFHHLTLCDLIKEFIDTVKTVQLQFLLPVDFHFADIDELSQFFLTVKQRFRIALGNRGCDNFNISADIRLRELEHPLPQNLRPIPDGVKRAPSLKKFLSVAPDSLEPTPSAKVQDEVVIPELIEGKPSDAEKQAIREVALFKKVEEEEATVGFLKALKALGKRDSISSTESEELPVEPRTNNSITDSLEIDDLEETISKRSQASEQQVGILVEEHTAELSIPKESGEKINKDSTVESRDGAAAPENAAIKAIAPQLIDPNRQVSAKASASRRDSRDRRVSVNVVSNSDKSPKNREKVLKKYRSIRTEEDRLKELSSLRERLQRQFKGRRERPRAALPLSVKEEGSEEESVGSNVKRRYTAEAATEVEKLSAYFQKFYLEERLPSPEPLILDTLAAYRDSAVASPPYPDGGVFVIEVKRTSKRPVSETMRIAKQAILFAARLSLWNKVPELPENREERLTSTKLNVKAVMERLRQIDAEM